MTETRAQPTPKAAAKPAVTSSTVEDAETVATRARDAERDRISTIYDLAGRLSLERGVLPRTW